MFLLGKPPLTIKPREVLKESGFWERDRAGNVSKAPEERPQLAVCVCSVYNGAWAPLFQKSFSGPP